MDTDGRFRRALAAFGGDGDVWDLMDAALAAAERDTPDVFCVFRDRVVEHLFAGARCRNCGADVPSAPAQPRKANAAAAAAEVSPATPDEEVDVDGLDDNDEAGAGAGAGFGSKILEIRDFLEDPDQSENEMVSLLQNLADMDVTYKALEDTDICRRVSGLRKHPSSEVRQMVKLLVRKWKVVVDDWVRLRYSGGDGGGSIISNGESPDKVQPKYHENTQLQVSDFNYSPSPQGHNVSSSESSSNNNLVESTMEKCRTSPAPAYLNTKQNNSNNYSTISSSAPARAMGEQKNTLFGPEKLDSARKMLQENYQESENGWVLVELETAP